MEFCTEIHFLEKNKTKSLLRLKYFLKQNLPTSPVKAKFDTPSKGIIRVYLEQVIPTSSWHTDLFYELNINVNFLLCIETKLFLFFFFFFVLCCLIHSHLYASEILCDSCCLRQHLKYKSFDLKTKNYFIRFSKLISLVCLKIFGTKYNPNARISYNELIIYWDYISKEKVRSIQ